MNNNGSNLYIVTALVIGLTLGLVTSLAISPVEARNAAPSLLGRVDKDTYRAMIGLAYNARGELSRATARLALLKDADPRAALAAQAQQSIAADHPVEESRGLALLAAALGQVVPTVDLTAAHAAGTTEPFLTLPPSTPLATMEDLTPPTLTAENTKVSPPTGEPSSTPVNTPLPPATATPEPLPTANDSPPAAYILSFRESLCDVELMQQLQVTVLDAAGNPLFGRKIITSWEGGEDSFFTGLQPRYGTGFADFEMQPGTAYNVRMAEGGATAYNVSAPNCRTDSGMDYAGGVVLTFTLQ